MGRAHFRCSNCEEGKEGRLAIILAWALGLGKNPIIHRRFEVMCPLDAWLDLCLQGQTPTPPTNLDSGGQLDWSQLLAIHPHHAWRRTQPRANISCIGHSGRDCHKAHTGHRRLTDRKPEDICGARCMFCQRQKLDV